MSHYDSKAISVTRDNADETLPPIDKHRLLSHCMGSKSLAAALLTDLNSSGFGTVENICRLIATHDFDSAGEAAHSLKGAAGIIAADSLRECAAKLEHACKHRQLGEIDIWSEGLHQEMLGCLQHLPELLEALTM